MKILNKKGPKIDPCGTPNNISLHELYLSFIFTLFFYLRGNHALILKAFCKKVYASSLANKSS